ncbi:hypothetical protein L6164_022372 [Bauhinia variegata]|nr:hypothetical protein L6164_022372 [Bauhinia variegata]
MSTTVSAEQHKFHHPSPHLQKKSLNRDIDIPPRKLLTRRANAGAAIAADSPRFSSAEETLLQKFLPYNNLVESDDESDPYSSDHFRMYEFKVGRCTRSRSHDWTDCPFAHPGEKARRRDPRKYHYSGTVCPEYRRGGCSRGDSCEFAHGVFECWLHPARYRTEACKDGKNCKRKVCFFAHTPRQLRILPVNSYDSSADISCKNSKFLNNNCCLFCHCSSTSSPTSTLLSMSHFSPPLSPSSSSVSPPLSPVKQRWTANGFSPISRYSDRFGGSETSSGLNHGVFSYKDVLTELMSFLEGLNFCEASAVSASAHKASNLPWVDASFNFEDQQLQQFILSPTTSFNCEDQQQFILSPFTQTPTSSGSVNFSDGNYSSNESKVVTDNGSSCPAPDLGWVNDLLM